MNAVRPGGAPTLIKTDSRVFQVTGDDESSEVVEIRERSLTLVQTTSLLLGKGQRWHSTCFDLTRLTFFPDCVVTVEYVVLAILAFPWSYSILGMAGGIITTMIVAVTTLYTSLILWKYCLRHPQIR